MSSRILIFLGLFLLILSIVCLSGPGTIDISDGRTRFEAARGLVDTGDVAIQDGRASFAVFPGRDGKDYSAYRYPHVLAGAATIALVDVIYGAESSDLLREFWFSLIGAVFAAISGVLFLSWFRRCGLSYSKAAFWSLAGVLCNPVWYYATSTFNEFLGTAAVVGSLVVIGPKRTEPIANSRALLAGVVMGIAFNCKPNLILFAPILFVLCNRPGKATRERWPQWLVLVAGMLSGVLTYQLYRFYKFPPETRAMMAEMLEDYAPTFADSIFPGIVGLLFSPAASVFLYAPAVLLSINGLILAFRKDKWLTLVVLGCCAAFFGSVSTLSFFKGDPCWGPRYLTPMIAILWLYAPSGARNLGKVLVSSLLLLGILVQILGLTVDPKRLYLQQNYSLVFYIKDPLRYFKIEASHLLQRPREIRELAATADTAHSGDSDTITTLVTPQPDLSAGAPGIVPPYTALNAFRPWLFSYRYVETSHVPIHTGKTAILFLLLGAGGVALLGIGIRPHQKMRQRAPSLEGRSPETGNQAH